MQQLFPPFHYIFPYIAHIPHICCCAVFTYLLLHFTLPCLLLSLISLSYIYLSISHLFQHLPAIPTFACLPRLASMSSSIFSPLLSLYSLYILLHIVDIVLCIVYICCTLRQHERTRDKTGQEKEKEDRRKGQEQVVCCCGLFDICLDLCLAAASSMAGAQQQQRLPLPPSTAVTIVLHAPPRLRAETWFDSGCLLVLSFSSGIFYSRLLITAIWNFTFCVPARLARCLVLLRAARHAAICCRHCPPFAARARRAAMRCAPAPAARIPRHIPYMLLVLRTCRRRATAPRRYLLLTHFSSRLARARLLRLLPACLPWRGVYIYGFWDALFTFCCCGSFWFLLIHCACLRTPRIFHAPAAAAARAAAAAPRAALRAPRRLPTAAPNRRASKSYSITIPFHSIPLGSLYVLLDDVVDDDGWVISWLMFYLVRWV